MSAAFLMRTHSFILSKKAFFQKKLYGFWGTPNHNGFKKLSFQPATRSKIQPAKKRRRSRFPARSGAARVRATRSRKIPKCGRRGRCGEQKKSSSRKGVER
jgi:hypothetical protein